MATPTAKYESKQRRDEYEAQPSYRTQDQQLGTSGQRLIILSHEVAAAQQDFLNSPGDGGDCVETFTANFGRGIQADIKVCDVPSSRQGDSTPFVDPVLFEDGNELCVLDVTDQLLGTYDFESDGRHFVVKVVDQIIFQDAGQCSRLFNLALATYLQGVQQSIEDADLVGLAYAEVRNRSAKYIAIDKNEYYLKDGKWVQGSGSVHSFVASERSHTKGLGLVNIGDVLKPASYKAPAKHARGNIFDAFGGLETNRWTGPAYLK